MVTETSFVRDEDGVAWLLDDDGDRWPVAEIVRETRWGALVACPWCRTRTGAPRLHEHAGPFEGWRVPHCVEPSGSAYYVGRITADSTSNERNHHD